MARINYKDYNAIISDARRDEANTVVAQESGKFVNLFSVPCNQEADGPITWNEGMQSWDGIIRAWGCSSIRTRPEERRNLKNALDEALITSPHLEYAEVEPRLGPRWVGIDLFDLFIAEHQLKRPESYVHATGVLRSNGTLASQSATTTPQLINQWTSTQFLLNTHLDGSGDRLEVDYGGRYLIESRVPFQETGVTYRFRLVKNTEYLTAGLERSVSPIHKTFTVDGVLPTDKFGISIETLAGISAFKLTGGWLGVRRIAS